jgi:hypothetical protein
VEWGGAATRCCTLFWGGFASISIFNQGDNKARAVTYLVFRFWLSREFSFSNHVPF